jgi:hypothetical protein
VHESIIPEEATLVVSPGQGVSLPQTFDGDDRGDVVQHPDKNPVEEKSFQKTARAKHCLTESMLHIYFEFSFTIQKVFNNISLDLVRTLGIKYLWSHTEE